MKFRDLVATGALDIKWPLVVDGESILLSGIFPPNTCRRNCTEEIQCSDTGFTGENICEYGVSFYAIQINSEPVVLYGVRGDRNNPKNRTLKYDLRGRYVTWKAVRDFVSRMENIIALIDTRFLQKQKEMLNPLHDPIRMAKQVNTLALAMLSNQSSGTTRDEQLRNAPDKLKTLVKASELLSDTFELLTIYFNPDAAMFGRRHSISIHGLLMKLVSIFKIGDDRSQKDYRVNLNGECHRNAFVYESFKLIPFALLSNAVKYSFDKIIHVRIEDRKSEIIVSVVSTGPLIESDEFGRIFDRGIRGRWGRDSTDGRGVGLYLARIIAEAHGFDINVESRPTGKSRGDLPSAVNRFWFEVPTGIEINDPVNNSM